MTDPILGGIGLGLVWGWWLVMATSATRARLWRAALVLGAASVILGVGIYLLANIRGLVGLIVAVGTASTAELAFRGALRQRRRSGA